MTPYNIFVWLVVRTTPTFLAENVVIKFSYIYIFETKTGLSPE